MAKEKIDEKVEDKKDDEQVEDKKEETVAEEEPKFTQAQVNAMMAEEKRQGKQSVIKQFGFESEEELDKTVKTFRAMMDATKTDEEKAKDEAGAANNESDKWKLEAEMANAKVEALSLDAKPENVDDVIVLARAKKTDEGDWKTAVQEVKTKYPTLFKDDKSKGKKGTGGDMSKSVKDGEKEKDEQSYGAKLAGKAKAKKETKHESYF